MPLIFCSDFDSTHEKARGLEIPFFRTVVNSVGGFICANTYLSVHSLKTMCDVELPDDIKRHLCHFLDWVTIYRCVINIQLAVVTPSVPHPIFSKKKLAGPCALA